MEPDPTSAAARFAGHLRPVQPADLPALAALFDAADRADQLFKLASAADIRALCMDPPATVPTRLIVAAGGVPSGTTATSLLGLGRLAAHFHPATHERVYQVLLRVHPAARPLGLPHLLARQLVALARELEADPATPLAAQVRMRTYLFASQTASITAWEQVGLRRVRTGWTMARPLAASIAAVPTPDGVLLRPYQYPTDNPQALDAFNHAFADYYDFQPVSPSAWEREWAAPEARPDLSWLACPTAAPAEVLGVAGCQVNAGQNQQTGRQEGWIEGLGVVPAYRQRGIGTALLTRCLHAFRTAGLDIALADVDAASVAAVGLFQRAGFTVRSALLQYERPLAAIPG
jgi:mycothiol synthase